MLQSNKIEALVNDLKEYINLKFELIKLEATERSASIGSSLVSKIVLVLLIILCLFFTSIGLGFYLSELMGNSYSGFLIIGLAYLILALIVLLGKKKIIEEPLRDRIIQELLNKKE